MAVTCIYTTKRGFVDSTCIVDASVLIALIAHLSLHVMASDIAIGAVLT